MTDVPVEKGPSPSDHGEPERDAVDHLGELWRIEHALSAVLAEVADMATLEDGELLPRLTTMERCRRAELEAVLPVPLAEELRTLLARRYGSAPGSTELRLELAQLAGWLDGLLASTHSRCWSRRPPDVASRPSPRPQGHALAGSPTELAEQGFSGVRRLPFPP